MSKFMDEFNAEMARVSAKALATQRTEDLERRMKRITIGVWVFLGLVAVGFIAFSLGLSGAFS